MVSIQDVAKSVAECVRIILNETWPGLNGRMKIYNVNNIILKSQRNSSTKNSFMIRIMWTNGPEREELERFIAPIFKGNYPVQLRYELLRSRL